MTVSSTNIYYNSLRKYAYIHTFRDPTLRIPSTCKFDLKCDSVLKILIYEKNKILYA